MTDMKFTKNNKLFGKEDVFPCYSIKLNDFIQEEYDIMPIRVYYNNQTDKACYVFIKSKDLDTALTEWKKRKETGNFYSPKDKEE